MKNPSVRCAAGVCAVLCIVLLRAEAQQLPLGAAGATAQRSEEVAIRKVAEDFTEAFNRGDAAAIAQHFTGDGVYIDADGQRFVGRESIQKEYETLFAKNSDLRLQLEIDSIDFANEKTAIEEGRLAVMPQPPGANRVMSHYTAIHSLQDNQWLIAHVRDTRVELPPEPGRLEDLDWLSGTWVASTENASLEAKFRWIEDQHYLARSHTVKESGKATSTGLQIVGMDPLTGQITSWSFTSDGSRAVGLWSPMDNGWSIQSKGVMNSGTLTAEINLISRKDKDTVVWQSVNRVVGDAGLPDTQEVTLKRQ